MAMSQLALRSSRQGTHTNFDVLAVSRPRAQWRWNISYTELTRCRCTTSSGFAGHVTRYRLSWRAPKRPLVVLKIARQRKTQLNRDPRTDLDAGRSPTRSSYIEKSE